MKYRVLSLLLVAIIGILPITSVAQAPYDEVDAYAIYSGIIANEWPVRAAKAQRLVIQAETETYPSYPREEKMCLTPEAGYEATLDPVIKAYSLANERTRLLQSKFDVTMPYELVLKASIEAMFKTKVPEEGGWPAFYKKYPNSGGTIHMSAVGFNAAKTLALVYMGHSCGLRCGGGEYHLLEKKDGKWDEIPWRGISCSWNS